MTGHPSHRPEPSSVGFVMGGTTLFVIGGLTFDSSADDDLLALIGLLCLALGLVGIIAGGVSLGTSRSG